MNELIEKLRKVKEKARLGGGEEKIAKIHEKGKLTARERIELLLDHDSFNEFNVLIKHKVIKELADTGEFLDVKSEFAKEIITGFARMNGNTAGIFANQPQVLAGALQ